MDRDMERAGINWVQVVAGALAAVSAAVLLSTIGVAGTITGAAVGSIAASIGTHLYTRGITASGAQLAAQTVALRRVGEARDDIDRVTTHPEGDAEAGLEHADTALGRAESDLQIVEKPGLPWRHIAVVALGLFVAVMVAITGFELATGRAVSTYTGGSDQGTGSTVPGVKPDKSKPPQTPSPTSGPTSAPTGTPTDTASPSQSPSVAPTETVNPTPPTPGQSATESPSDSATDPAP